MKSVLFRAKIKADAPVRKIRRTPRRAWVHDWRTGRPHTGSARRATVLDLAGWLRFERSWNFGDHFEHMQRTGSFEENFELEPVQ